MKTEHKLNIILENVIFLEKNWWINILKNLMIKIIKVSLLVRDMNLKKKIIRLYMKVLIIIK